MYRRRRRPSSTAVLPATRRTAAAESRSRLFEGSSVVPVDARQAPTPAGAATRTRRQHRRSIGTAYISSSSSASSAASSRSSSPTVGPVRYPVRQRPVTRSRTQDRTAFATAARCSGPLASGKPGFRSRRRALLRSPVFQFLLSPDSSAARHSTTPAVNNNQSASELSPAALDDSVQIIRTEPPVAAQRSLRGRTRSSRSTRRLTVPSSVARVPCSPPPLSQPSENGCGGLNLTAEVRAALTAAAEHGANGVTVNADDDCVICLCTKSNRSVVLPCMHTFCFDCIHRWLSINPSCPLCKRLAQRIIHSIMSDSRFTEVLVSDLQRAGSQRHHSGLEPIGNYTPSDGEMLSFAGSLGSLRQQQQQQHHHYHYHLGNASATSLPFLDFLVSRNLGSSRSTASSANTGDLQSLLLPSLLVPPESGSSSTSLTGLLEGSRPPLAFPWFSGVSSSTSESRRSLLTRLVNNGIRSQDSVLLDSLLLRQLVYILEVNSVPVNDGPVLERSVSPSFLAANETHRHRLAAFIRRELRVMAPWLAYPSTREEPLSRTRRLYEESATSSSDEVTLANAAITSPLIRGAPGFMADTQELDALTHLIVQHFTRVSMLDLEALVNLLTAHPMLHPSLVPTRYLEHFASEVIQFAQYSGTLDEYDSAVCLYRRSRQAPPGLTGDLTFRPRLAVYVASACLPRLRPGFAPPLGLVIHPLVCWLMHRLFTHSQGIRAGLDLSDQAARDEAVQSQSSTMCHSNCLMLATLTRTLLTSLPYSQRTVDSALRFSVANRRVGAAELWPNRLLYQRVISELIDHARFSEAIGTRYSHSHRIPTNVTPSSTTILASEAPASTTVSSDSENRHGGIVYRAEDTVSLPHVEPLTRDSARPIIQAHSLAIRRLRGLLFLFTDHISVLDDVRQEDGYFGELLNTPLLPIPERRMPSTGQPRNFVSAGANSAVIDLTTSNPASSDSQPQTATASRTDNHAPASIPSPACSCPRSSTTNFSGSDWNFLRRLPSSSSDSSDLVSTRSVVRSRQHLGVPTFRLVHRHDHQDGVDSRASVTDTLHTRDQEAFTRSNEWEDGLQNDALPEDSLAPYASVSEGEQQVSGPKRNHATENSHRWRSSLPCVVISSDSSSDEREYEDPLIGASTSSVTAVNNRTYLTSDDSDSVSSSLRPVFSRVASSPGMSQIASPNHTASNENSTDLMNQLGGMSQLLSNLEENPSEAVAKMHISTNAKISAGEVSANHSSSTEEPMDVDEPGDATTSMFLQRRIACRRSLMSDFLKCSQKKESLGHHLSHRKLCLSLTDSGALKFRRLSKPQSCTRLAQHSRSGCRRVASPISLGDSDSEFEFLQESITLRSSSSSDSASSSSSCCSTTSVTTSNSSKPIRFNRDSRSRSPAARSSDALRCSIHRCCGHVANISGKRHHKRHKRRKHHTGHRSCCHHSKYHRYRSGRRHNHRHHHHDRRRRCRRSSLCEGFRSSCLCSNTETPTIITVNSASSPILISDNDEGVLSLEMENGRVDSTTMEDNKWSLTLVPSTEKTAKPSTTTANVFLSTYQGDADASKTHEVSPAQCKPSSSYANGDRNSYDVPFSAEGGQQVEDDESGPSQEIEDHSAALVSTASLNVKVESIYEPAGAGDFYHFMDRLTTSAVIDNQDNMNQGEGGIAMDTVPHSPNEVYDKQGGRSPSLPAEKASE